MGLFDKLNINKTEPLSPQAGLLLSAITMVASDGSIDDDEISIIQRLDGSEHTANWDSAVKAFERNSIEDCISLACNAMNTQQRITAIANLIDIAMADGVLHGKEKQLLEIYVAAFEVDTSIVEKIVDVVSIKNNKSIFE